MTPIYQVSGAKKVSVTRSKMRHNIMLLVIILSLFPTISPPSAVAQKTVRSLHLKRIMERGKLNLTAPTGIFAIGPEQLLISQGEQSVTAKTTTLSTLSVYEDLLAMVQVPSEANLVLLTADAQRQQLYFFNRTTRTIMQMALQPDGTPAWTAATTLDSWTDNSVPTAATIAASGLILLGTNATGTPTLQRYAMPNTEETDSTNTSPLQSLNSVALAMAEIQPPALLGLASHPQSGHLFTINRTTQRLLELTQDGQLVAEYDLGAFNLQTIVGLTIAPSADQTDAPETQNLYLLDRINATDESAAVGRVFEFSFTSPPAMVQNATVDLATLVNLVNTSEFNPPSPDPAGIAYIPPNPHTNTGNRLLISDSEVNEMKLYDGANFFETTLAGELMVTYTTFPTITGEPAGLTINLNNGSLFITDDDNIRPLIEVEIGADKEFLSGDETFRKTGLRDNSLYGNQDPEGVEHVFIDGEEYAFILDGLNSELYVARPGPNGIFDGTDDIVVNHDTFSQGVEDPEGIAYNPSTGTLYIVGKPPTSVAELTVDGQFIRYIDISAANPDKPAGLAVGPGSNNAQQLHLYIVDRGVDNDSDSSENDGRLYEFTIPAGENRAPVVTLAETLTVNWPAAALLTGTVTDDGQPEPPMLTTLWSKVAGPGDVTFGDTAAIDTTASFSIPGIYQLQLTASDSLLEGSAMMTVTVEANNLAPLVDAGLDQSVELSETITVSATATDDGLPLDPGVLSVSWQAVDGPGDVTFGNANQATTSAIFDQLGVYVLQATATDGELSSSDQLTVTVLPNNLPPTVIAGTDQRIGLGDSTVVTATVEDDGLPDPPAQLTYSWRALSGPGATSFGTPNALTSTVTFTARGTYQLEIEASDGKLSATDSLTIVVEPNKAPVVNAGPNLQTTLSETVTLAGQVSDDGIPTPPGGVEIEWRKKSGPGTVTFGNRHAASTTASVDKIGIYVLELHATDGILVSSDTMTLNVGQPNLPPTIVPPVGGTNFLTSTTDISVSVVVTDDWIPAASGQLEYQWEKVSGPSGVSFGTPKLDSTAISFTESGQYEIRITAFDGELSSSLDFLIMINFAPEIAPIENIFLSKAQTVQLTANATDDGIPASSTLSYNWSQQEGPVAVNVSNSDQATAAVEITTPGIYTFKIEVSDGVAMSQRTVRVTFDPTTGYELFLPIIR